MGSNGKPTVEERARQICLDQQEQITKKELMKAHNCSVKTANEVYRLKGWRVVSKAEAAKMGLNKRRVSKPISGFDLLRRAWR